MRLLDALTALTLGEHEPDTYVSIMFYGASYYFGAHIGCVHRAHNGNRVKEVYLFDGDDEPVGENRRCYYCERDWMKSAIKPIQEAWKLNNDHHEY